MQGKRGIGQQGEDRAAAYLAEQGLTLIARNFHTQLGEVDLIFRYGDEIVFVEVKLRSSDAYGTALESLTPRKLGRVQLAAEEWLQQNSEEDADWRIDLVAIQSGEIEWVQRVGA